MAKSDQSTDSARYIAARHQSIYWGDPLGDIRVTVAGRTDTGVHALGQVAHFETNIDRAEWSWVRGLNAFLPESISIQWAKLVDHDFDARFSAYERSYAYFVMNSPVKIPLLHKKAGFNLLPPGKRLDVKAMQEASQLLIGEHDFSCFRSSECQSKSPVKTIYQLDIVDDYPRTYIFVRANAFLHHMVRNLVGSLLMIGNGKQDIAWLKQVLELRNRALAAPTFAADGLYLAKVGYPKEYGIPESNFGSCAIPERFLESAFTRSF